MDGSLGRRRATRPPLTLEINSIRHLDGDIVEYRVEPTAPAAGRKVRELALPETALIAMIARGDEVIPPRGRTLIQSDDYVFVVMKPDVRPVVDRMFSPRRTVPGGPFKFLELPIDARTRVGDLENFYGVHLDPDPARTLGDLMSERLGDELEEGAEILAGDIRLAARRVVDGKVELVGVEILLEG